MPRGRPPKGAKSRPPSSTASKESSQPSKTSHIEASSSVRKRRFAAATVKKTADLDHASSSTSTRYQALRATVIPASCSSLGSSLSSLGDQTISESDDTPATSVVVTPAEYIMRLPSSLPTPLPSTHSKEKRKRTADEDLAKADQLLAQTLQEKEWNETIQSRLAPKRRRLHVIDSEDENEEEGEKEEDDLAEADPDAGDSEDSSESRLPLLGRRTSLEYQSRPERHTRLTGQKSLTSRKSHQIQDSASDGETELSEVSAFILEQDSFDSDGSDIEQQRPNTATAADAACLHSGHQTTSTPAVNRMARRAGRPQARNRLRGHRRQVLDDRATRERRKLEKAHPEILSMWEDLESIPRITPTQASQPTAITRTLKSFQLEGLDWMTKQEQSHWKGGLLGDEMGMGKTIQAVSLVMSDYPAKDPTLVVVPPVALMQWQSEIQHYTDGKLKILIYHNTNPKVKGLTIKDLRTYDIIMISYSGLESIYRKESKGWKREEGLVKENSKIHALRYHRIILDEAHSIKTRTTSVSKACFALNANFRWCLSGTPVQNRIGEFFSLLRFLQITPFASYFCKKCPCSRLQWNQDADKRCSNCQHTGFEHVSIFNQELLNPITQQGDAELRREGLRKLRLVTDRIMLRRMKRDHTASMELPPKEVVIHKEFFGEIERDFSASIMSNTHRQFDTYVSRGVMLNNYANIFGLIMQMRQVANHPDLILRKHGERDQNVLVCCICDETAEEPIRSRCHHEFCRKCAKDYVRTFETETPDCPRCHIPLSIDIDQPDIEQNEDTVKRNSIINRIKMENWTSSTKIEMLVYDLYRLRSKKQTQKSIVFSQFTSMLQLVEWRLRRAGFNTVMLDGSMSPAQRQKSIDYFMKNVDVEVFLVSLKAGGVALNLTEASRVFIVDPWWNPAAEWQSADRCHRIGQKRPCVITRLCIEDSVESRIVMLQEKKANMINGTINNDQVAIEKLTPEDMQFLFRGS